MKKALLQTLVMWVLMSATAMAQSITVKGKVTDESGAPVPSATIQVKKSGTAVATDPQGNFSISAAPGNVLVISAVGFEGREVAVFCA